MKKALLASLFASSVVFASNFGYVNGGVFGSGQTGYSVGVSGGPASVAGQNMTGDLGLVFGYKFNQDYGMDINYNHVFAGSQDISNNIFSANLRKLIPWNSVVSFYVKGGTGFINNVDNGNNSHNTLSLLLGGGVNFTITPNIGVFIDETVYTITQNVNLINAGLEWNF